MASHVAESCKRGQKNEKNEQRERSKEIIELGGCRFRAAMAPNYYSELELERDASAKQINQAFRKLALKLHPDKHGGDEKALLAFAAVCEAYEVLSEPRHRALYDQFEEAGLKDGVPDGKGGLLGGTYRFSGDAQRIFETFFGSASPFGDIYGGARAARARRRARASARPRAPLAGAARREGRAGGARAGS